MNHSSLQPGGTTEPSAADLVRSSIGHNAAQLIGADPTARAGRDVEGVHQMRVATRRLRAELRLLSPAMRQKPTARLRTELAWLGRSLGAARDLDTLAPHLTIPTGLPGAGQLEVAIIERLAEERAAARRSTTKVLSSSRYQRLLVALVVALADPPLRSIAVVPARGILTPQLRRSTSELLAAVASLPNAPTAIELHQIRILSKRLRYAAMVAASFEGVTATTVAATLGHVQDALGDARDARRSLVLLDGLPRTPSTNDALTALRAACTDEASRGELAWRPAFDAALPHLRSLGWSGV